VRKNRALIITPAITGVEDIEMESNEGPPSEWRYDWFKGRKNKRIVMVIGIYSISIILVLI